MGNYMGRKNLVSLILTSTMVFMWACGEGDVANLTDADEMVKKIISEKSDREFLEAFAEHCEKSGECKVDLSESSSSEEDDEESSSSAAVSSSAKSKSSSSVKSGSSKNSSSSKKSSSSAAKSSNSGKTSSSATAKSSSSVAQLVSGVCELLAPDVIHVGDEVIWRYIPDENSLEYAEYEWDVSNEIENGLLSGSLKGKGFPEDLTVAFQNAKNRKKYGPTLIYDGVEIDCPNIDYVYDVGEEPTSSSSAEVKSSSAKAKSSSSVASSSSAAPVVKGHCAVSKAEVYVGDEVEWYVAGPDGEVLENSYNWIDIGVGGVLVSGEQKGKGLTKIVVKYSDAGTKSPMVQYAKQGLLMCDVDEDGNPMLTVLPKIENSSSSKKVVNTSSSMGSSSSRAVSRLSSSFDPGVIDF